MVLAMVVGCGSAKDDAPPKAGAEKLTARTQTNEPPADDPVTSIVDRVVDQPVDDPMPADPGEVFRKSDNRPLHDDARLARLGIRRFASKRLVLYTDIDPTVAAPLPALVDAAYAQWVDYFGELPPDRERTEFQVTGYLIGDKQRFDDAGLVPGDLPRFLNGRHRDYEFWMYEQEHDYYRRHLLLHEATHCYTTALPGVRLPIWYLEGLAELFATHTVESVKGQATRVEGDAGSEGSPVSDQEALDPRPSTLDPLALRVMPHDKESFAGLGRISLIEEAVAAGRLLSLDEVAALQPNDYLKPEAYAWAWAAVKFLDGHPRYAERFRQIGREVVVAGVPFVTSFAESLGADRADIDAEWPAFVCGLRTGYDLERAAITFARGEPGPRSFELRSDRGWQSTGVLVERGRSYLVTAEGRITLANEPKPWVSEANGISFRYVDDHRIGRLLATVRPSNAADRPNAMRDVTPLGNRGRFEASVTGTLYLRANDDWGELADNTGTFSVRVVRE